MRGSIDNSSRRGGYLLIEVLLAIGLAAGLLGAIFGIASGSMSMAQKIVDEGRLQTKQQAFLGFLGRSFEQLPGNAVLELETRETSRRFLPRLVIQNAPASFSFEGLPISAQAVVLTTVPVPSGGVNVVLEYYEELLLDDEEQVGEERQKPAGTLILYRDVWRFELRVLDARTMELISDWDIRGRLPLQVELNAVFDPNGEEVIHHFWIPPKSNPTTLMRGMERSSSANPNQTGGQNPNQGGPQTPEQGGTIPQVNLGSPRVNPNTGGGR